MRKEDVGSDVSFRSQLRGQCRRLRPRLLAISGMECRKPIISDRDDYPARYYPKNEQATHHSKESVHRPVLRRRARVGRRREALRRDAVPYGRGRIHLRRRLLGELRPVGVSALLAEAGVGQRLLCAARTDFKGQGRNLNSPEAQLFVPAGDPVTAITDGDGSSCGHGLGRRSWCAGNNC